MEMPKLECKFKVIYNSHEEVINVDTFKEILTPNNLIALPVILVDLTGDYESAIMLSQLIYWTGRTKDGWIYKTYNDWHEELRLSEHKARKAKKTLEKLGLIETKLKKANGTPVVHYKINKDILVEKLINLSNPDSNLENSQIPFLKTHRFRNYYRK